MNRRAWPLWTDPRALCLLLLAGCATTPLCSPPTTVGPRVLAHVCPVNPRCLHSCDVVITVTNSEAGAVTETVTSSPQPAAARPSTTP